MRTDTPKTIYLKDYQPPLYLAHHIELEFKIFEDKTLVKATTHYKKNAKGSAPLILNGEHLKLVSVDLDGDEPEYEVDDKFLTISSPDKEEFTLTIITEIDPASNTRLEGLYKSGGNWCTQCEAEGFRTITYFYDRPDVMATFKVRLEADKKTCPVLLSNGNLIEEGDLSDDDTRHYALWHDPFPKPCYLFALVAGDLVFIEDSFQTKSRREVLLRIYVRDGDQTQCDWAMESLKASMKWDEDVYGREYELDRFNIVAVSDFNMGAMENTSLNIFNTALVLAHQDTATDTDFERVEGVIAHEYFHNWTGNRVTCRDWFQLSLKEGLTVFRDQQFSADMNSAEVQRISDVALLRRLQFAEDAGPMAHPIRPDNYMEINNFYTVTVYEKGAEVIRMQHTLLGADTYRKATDLYFERHDGQAVTCEDFVKCMQDASGIDLDQFFLWYKQAGTPEVDVSYEYDQNTQKYTLNFKQRVPETPGQSNKEPMHIPIKVGLLNDKGEDIAQALIELKDEKTSYVFDDISSKPIPSLLRGFSAPVKINSDLSEDDHRFLMVNDNDGFNRWESGRKYFLGVLQTMIDQGSEVPQSFIDAYKSLLDDALKPDSDKALFARKISIPDIPSIAQEQKQIDTDLIHGARENMLNTIAEVCRDKLLALYEENKSSSEFKNDAKGRGKRVLQNTVYHLLSNRLTEDDAAMTKAHYDSAHNMTDRMAAFMVGCALEGSVHEEIIHDFYERYKDYPLVIDKWFAGQAMIHLPKTMQVVAKLREHEDFNIKNPNRVRSLYAAFAMNNPVRFHEKSGAGYKFLVDAIIELNEINPQIASRLVTPLREWRRYTDDRQELMSEQLNRILELNNLSTDVYEVVSKTLA